MLKITGSQSEAVVFASLIDQTSIDQIAKMMDNPSFAGNKVRIMPDVHAGAGSVIGLTSTLGDKVIPNVIGVDIGCGVVLDEIISDGEICFKDLDRVIRKNIPSGMHRRNCEYEHLAGSTKIGKAFREIEDRIIEICDRTQQNKDTVINSIGTLGGGNHYIEVDVGEKKYLSIHSGSRNFGLKIANYHQAKAAKAHPEIAKDLCWLEGDDASEYFSDMRVAQKYASLNRLVMLDIIFREMDWNHGGKIESIHNYIDFEGGIIRKGAISALYGQMVVIPISMAEGVIVGKGKGNSEWNNSAPHGAGRLVSRNVAKKTLSMDEYKSRMDGVWTSCVSKDTLDEAPMVYKGLDYVLESVKETVDVVDICKPVYNFKATE